MKTNDELAREAAEVIEDAIRNATESDAFIDIVKMSTATISAAYAPALEERDRDIKELNAIRKTPQGEAWHVAACLQAAVADNAAILEALKENALIVRYPGVTHCVLCDESGETEVNHGPRCPLAKDHPGQAILETLAERDRLLAEANERIAELEATLNFYAAHDTYGHFKQVSNLCQRWDEPIKRDCGHIAEKALKGESK